MNRPPPRPASPARAPTGTEMRRCAFLTMADRAGYVIDDGLAEAPLAALGWRVELLVDGVPKPKLGRNSMVELADVESWLGSGRDIRTVLDASYPAPLRQIFDRPPLLFVRGDWRGDSDWRSVAVVGTREPSPEGLRRAARVARELVAAGFTVVSGLAKGIDTAAHTAALAAGGRTIAVLGSGLERVYPAQNRGLAEQIVDSGGALVSQFFPHQSPTRWSFPMRNVVMSGLSLATVVVEAGQTSGARMQARLALQHGRSVFLLRSLVEGHAWARKYVEEGAYGTQAVAVESTEEIAALLTALPERESLAV